MADQKAKTEERFSDYNPNHVPWWKKDKYLYHERDPVTYKKIRPGTKMKKMGCQHFLTMETFMTMKRQRPGCFCGHCRRPQEVCPICRKPIPEDDLEKVSLAKPKRVSLPAGW